MKGATAVIKPISNETRLLQESEPTTKMRRVFSTPLPDRDGPKVQYLPDEAHKNLLWTIRRNVESYRWRDMRKVSSAIEWLRKDIYQENHRKVDRRH